MSDTAATSKAFEQGYDSSESDIVLVSEDGKYFRVQSYLLRAFSVVFRDMLEGTAIGSTDQDPEIPIGAPAAAVRRFLDMLTSADPTLDADIAMTAELVKLCEKFDCKHLLGLLKPELHRGAKVMPWAMFCLAAQYDYLDLAKTALASMGNDGRLKSTRGTSAFGCLTVDLARACTMEYLVSFITAVGLSERQSNSGQPVDWTGIASVFKVGSDL